MPSPELRRTSVRIADIHVSQLSRENRILPTRATEERAKPTFSEFTTRIVCLSAAMDLWWFARRSAPIQIAALPLVNLSQDASNDFCMRAGQQLRINAQLVRVRDDFPLWSGRYDRELSDLFAIQDENTTGMAKTTNHAQTRTGELWASDAPTGLSRWIGTDKRVWHCLQS